MSELKIQLQNAQMQVRDAELALGLEKSHELYEKHTLSKRVYTKKHLTKVQVRWTEIWEVSERVYTKKHLTKVHARWTGIWEVSERVYTKEHLKKVQARTKSKVEAGKWAKRLAITKKIGEGKDLVKVLGEHVGELEGNGQKSWISVIAVLQ